MLAIHCSLAHSGAWWGMGRAMGDLVTLHAYDLPCHGKSGDWDGQGVMHDAATDMALRVLDCVGTEPIDIIGHSFGATVALRLAIEHPDRVRSAVMFEPVYFAPAFADDPDFGAKYARDTADFDTAMVIGDNESAARAFNAAWGDATAWEHIRKTTRDYMAARIHFVQDSSPFLIHDSAGLLMPGRFDAATMPILLMRAPHSPWAAALNGAIARRLPNASEVVLDGVGHMAPITDPDVVAAPVRTFLDTV